MTGYRLWPIVCPSTICVLLFAKSLSLRETTTTSELATYMLLKIASYPDLVANSTNLNRLGAVAFLSQVSPPFMQMTPLNKLPPTLFCKVTIAASWA